MDIDATINGETVSIEDVQRMIVDIISLDLSDGASFKMNGISEIMEESEYPGVRIAMTAYMDRIKVPLKVDISTGDVITPRAVEYSYKLMFEDRSIRLLAYNLETVLAEKLETIIVRATANTRMRDFYDIHILLKLYRKEIDPAILTNALLATSGRRGSAGMLENAEKVLYDLHDSRDMEALWENYRTRFSYAKDISWRAALRSVRELAVSANLQVKRPSVIEQLNELKSVAGKTPVYPKKSLER